MTSPALLATQCPPPTSSITSDTVTLPQPDISALALAHSLPKGMNVLLSLPTSKKTTGHRRRRHYKKTQLGPVVTSSPWQTPITSYPDEPLRVTYPDPSCYDPYMTSRFGDGLDDDDYGDYNGDLGGMFGEEVYNNIDDEPCYYNC